MKIRGDKLGRLAEKAGVTRDQLAQAVVRTGLDEKRAASAVRNWLSGRDHPRCKAGDVAKLAAAVGAKPKEIARFTSEIRYHRGSARKAGLLATLIRGKPVDVALNLLGFTTKRAAVNMRKALSAAIADAEQFEADVTQLVVAESRVNQAPIIKRFRPKDRGRSHPIQKPQSHVTIGVQERD